MMLPTLFKVTYLDDCDFNNYLTVGTSKEQVQERETTKLENSCSCFMNCTVEEIKEVDGYNIVVT